MPESDSGFRATNPMSKSICSRPACPPHLFLRAVLLAMLLLAGISFDSVAPAQTMPSAQSSSCASQSTSSQECPQAPRPLSPRAAQAQRFLLERGIVSGRSFHGVMKALSSVQQPALGGQTTRTNGVTKTSTVASGSASATWQPIGPSAVLTPSFGLVSGRVTSLALDPNDATGNTLYVGTTGGGVWKSNDAGTSALSSIVFIPLTDAVAALGGAPAASISIGALTVQPGGTGVILAGTGDPNDGLDSYYGAGILRSSDGGVTWSLIPATVDKEGGQSLVDFSFIGEGFAGFAWSTTNPQVVVATVSQAFEGTIVDADVPDSSYEGIYYSQDSGASWHLATISDGSGRDVQGPRDTFALPDGNAATSVVWNPIRGLFISAVRYHGYYQSVDGILWSRMAAQPAANLTTQLCPTNPQSTGSIACPIFRGALAVNPQTGDTFAWTVDINDQDQGLWQDQCSIATGNCGNPTITFSKQWNTAPLEANTLEGAATIVDGSYNLALSAAPSAQDTLLLAGANDLWKCSLAMGCVWRNTTNSTTCMSAQVGEFEHTITWNLANPMEIFIGNDSGLWRSTDAIGETGSPCSSTDSTHFQNLNGSLGSLAEVQSLSSIVTSPFTALAGLGVNGTAGEKATAITTSWPQILSGFGGPVAIDPVDSTNWYVNNQQGVSVYQCSQSAACTPGSFGTTPVVTDADVGGDGYAMPTPAPFLVDPIDHTQLLIGTCRVWRGPAGSGWSASNAISPILDSGATGSACSGDALIRSMAAMQLPDGAEIIYVGMYGSATNGSNLPGHILSAVIDPASSAPLTWNDLTQSAVSNDTHTFNSYGFDISGIAIDAHDTTGNTIYVTIAAIAIRNQQGQRAYRTTNGGATWQNITAYLPDSPANSVVIDPQDANTVYVATDVGVYFTAAVSNCAPIPASCWSAFGVGLPGAPAVALSASPAGVVPQALQTATYGRGIWQTPLWSSSTALSDAVASPASLTFGSQVFATASSPLAITLLNTGSVALAPTSIAKSPGFTETDNCVNVSIPVGGSCTIQVTFTPQATGPVSGQLIVYANIYGGQLSVDLSGTGAPAGIVTLTPASVPFGLVQVNTTSSSLQVTVTNAKSTAIPVSSVVVTSPFALVSNSCGTASIAANTSCAVQVAFAPTQTSAASGLLTFTDAAGIQSVTLTGTGAAAPTDILGVTTLSFPSTPGSQLSAAQSVTITNIGDLPLTGIVITPSAQFQQSSNFVSQIAAHSVGTVSVQFAPTQVGNIQGTLTIVDAVRTQTVALSGTGLAAPAFSLAPASLTFTNQQPGVASAPQTVTITNTGGSSLANVGFQISGSAASSYAVASTTCGAQLNSGSSCTAQIVFTPTACGSIAASLAISSSTPGVQPVPLPLNGSGQLSGGIVTNPSQLTFPAVASGQSSAAQQITITNSTSYAIGPFTLAASGSFTLSQNNCSGSLAAGANCTASIVFTPNVSGPFSGSLTISSPVVAAPTVVGLAGAGFDFTVSVSGPTSVTVASGQQAGYTLVVTPNGATGSFSFACGTLPTNALCLFNPTSESLASGVNGNVLVQVSTGTGGAAHLNHSSPWRLLPLACGLFALPFALRRRSKLLLLALFAFILATSVTSCTSSGGGSGNGGTGGQGNSNNTPAGTYTIPVTLTSMGINHSVNLSLTVD